MNTIKMDKNQYDNGTISVILSFTLVNTENNKTYSVLFNNDDFSNNNNFKLTLFHFEY